MASSIRPRSVRRAAARAETRQARDLHPVLLRLQQTLADDTTFNLEGTHFDHLMALEARPVHDPSFGIAYAKGVVDLIFQSVKLDDAASRMNLYREITACVAPVVAGATDFTQKDPNHPLSSLRIAVNLHLPAMEETEVEGVHALATSGDQDQWRLFLLCTFCSLLISANQVSLATEEDADTVEPLLYLIHRYTIFMSALLP